MQFNRQELMIGKEGVEKLNNSKVIVFGLGGVGGFTVEALVRAGVGDLTIVDFDDVDITNINRQIIATHKTIGENKTDLFVKRAKEIYPEINIRAFTEKFLPENALDFFDKEYDYAVDAIDLVTSKLKLIEVCKEKDIPIISSMGFGNKIEPTMIEVADISKTSVCPLAKVIRKELKKRRIKKVKTVFSKEIPNKPDSGDSREKCRNVGSISFVPSVAGLVIASEVVKDIIK